MLNNFQSKICYYLDINRNLFIDFAIESEDFFYCYEKVLTKIYNKTFYFMKKMILYILFLLSTFYSHAQFPESFETGVPPVGWTSFIGTNGEGVGSNWTTSSNYASGSQAAYVMFEDVTDSIKAEDWLVTTQFTPSPSADVLTFMQQQEFSINYGSIYTIRVSTASQTIHTDFVIVDTQTEADFGTSYTRHNVDLSAYDGIPIYVAFVMENDDGDDWYIDDVDLIYAASQPNCVTNHYPYQGTVSSANAALVTLSWDAPAIDSTHDAATSYQISWGTEPGVYTSTITSDQTTVNMLDVSYNTTYYWSVVALNVGGSSGGCQENNFTTSEDTSIPYTNNFVVYPGDFSEATGDYGFPQGSQGAFMFDYFGNNPNHVNGRSVRINIFGSFIDEYFISPAFDLSGGTHYLNYDLALTSWNLPNQSTLGVDDYVALLVTENGGTSWQELSRWDASTPISNTGQAATEIELSNYGSSVQFAFYAFSDVVNADIDFFIDNFRITSGTLKIENNSIEGLVLFPTIIQERLYYKSNYQVSAISIYNLLGQKVFFKTPKLNDSSINLSNLRAGMYIVKITAQGKTGTYRIIKE